MTQDNTENLSKLVNTSGFLFQLAVEHLVTSNPDQPCRVVSREHPWKTPDGNPGGFIDLILAVGTGMIWVCECKRTRDADWIFLVEPGNQDQTPKIRCSWVAGVPGKGDIAGWSEITFQPKSHESAFCVIRGSGEKDSPLLERTAGHLLQSQDALIGECVDYTIRKRHEYKVIYIPIIITNARLQVCKMHPRDVSLSSGTLGHTDFTEVPMIRFRKTLSFQAPPNSIATDVFEATRERERTVLVINSESLLRILKSSSMRTALFEDQNPVDVAFDQLQQKTPR